MKKTQQPQLAHSYIDNHISRHISQENGLEIRQLVLPTLQIELQGHQPVLEDTPSKVNKLAPFIPIAVPRVCQNPGDW